MREVDAGNEHLEYQFENYRLSNWEQVYYEDGERQAVSTKPYHLLLLLVKNAGRVVSKSEIIQTVWPGQVVTDAALAKQVLRLRKLLQDHPRDQPFIETHRGIGYRFTPTVSILKAKPSKIKSNSSRSVRRWYWLAAMFALGLLFAALWLKSGLGFSSPSPKQAIAELTAEAPIKVAVLPLGTEHNWLNAGGRNYLAETLSQDPKISSVSPAAKWLTETSGESLAVNLSTQGNLDYSFLISIFEEEGEYRAALKLRTDSAVLSATDIQAKSLPNLFDRTGHWVRNNIAVHAKLDDLAPASARRIADAALQSYLQGQFEVNANENRIKAGEYFQAAVAQDPDFLEAWTELARNHMALGEFQEAISIAQTVLAKSEEQLSAELLLNLNYIIGISYGRQHKVDETLHYLKRARALISESNDPYSKLAALEALSALAIYEKRYADAEALAIESLGIAENDFHLPNYLADLHFTIARAIDASGDPERSLEHINQALDFWRQSDNANGMMKAYYLLSHYYYQMGFIDEGIQLLVKAEPYLNSASLYYEKAFFLQNGGLLLNLRGQFKHANRYADQLKSFAIDSNNPIYLVLSELIGVHQLYVQNRFSEASEHALAILRKFESEDSVQASFPDIMALAILTSSRGKPVAETRALIDSFDASYKSHRERLRNDLSRSEAHLAIREGRIDQGLRLLQESETNNRNKGFRHIGDYIATEALEVLLQHPGREFQQILAQTELSAGYGYLLWKLKAQFMAREGDYFAAARILSENKLKANQLWSAEDQLLLEEYQARSAGL